MEKTKAKLKPHYVDNKKFLQAMIEHRTKVAKGGRQEKKTTNSD